MPKIFGVDLWKVKAEGGIYGTKTGSKPSRYGQYVSDNAPSPRSIRSRVKRSGKRKSPTSAYPRRYGQRME